MLKKSGNTKSCEEKKSENLSFQLNSRKTRARNSRFSKWSFEKFWKKKNYSKKIFPQLFTIFQPTLHVAPTVKMSRSRSSNRRNAKRIFFVGHLKKMLQSTNFCVYRRKKKMKEVLHSNDPNLRVLEFVIYCISERNSRRSILLTAEPWNWHGIDFLPRLYFLKFLEFRFPKNFSTHFHPVAHFLLLIRISFPRASSRLSLAQMSQEGGLTRGPLLHYILFVEKSLSFVPTTKLTCLFTSLSLAHLLRISAFLSLSVSYFPLSFSTKLRPVNLISLIRNHDFIRINGQCQLLLLLLLLTASVHRLSTRFYRNMYMYTKYLQFLYMYRSVRLSINV